MAKKTKTHTDSASGDLGDQVRDITQATWFANQQGWLNKTMLSTTDGNRADGSNDTSVTTDKADYHPGDTATITAKGFARGSTVEFSVQHVIGPGADGVYGTADDVLGDNSGSGHLPWTVTDGGASDLDGQVNGHIQTSWYVNPDDSAGARFLLTATGNGADGVQDTNDDERATTTFTDKPSVDLSQWSNGPAPDADGTGSEDESWQNGNLGAQQAHFAEGEAIAYRAKIDELNPGSNYSYTIQWDTFDSGAYALDYLTGYNFTWEGTKHPLEPDPNPTSGITDISPGGVHLVAIPADLQLLTGFGHGITDGLDIGSGLPSGAQNFSVFGAVSGLSTSAITYNADLSKASITINFTYNGAADNTRDAVVIAWGGHIASSLDWRDDPGETVQTASDIAGSPYHMRHLALYEDGVLLNIGNQDRSLSAAAVVPAPPQPPADITVYLDDDALTGGNPAYKCRFFHSPLPTQQAAKDFL